MNPATWLIIYEECEDHLQLRPVRIDLGVNLITTAHDEDGLIEAIIFIKKIMRRPGFKVFKLAKIDLSERFIFTDGKLESSLRVPDNLIAVCPFVPYCVYIKEIYDSHTP